MTEQLIMAWIQKKTKEVARCGTTHRNKMLAG